MPGFAVANRSTTDPAACGLGAILHLGNVRKIRSPFRGSPRDQQAQRRRHRFARDEARISSVTPAAIPGFARLTLWFRIENVLAAVSVTAACDPQQPDASLEARNRTESLAALLVRRLAMRVPGITLPSTPVPPDARQHAEAVCPERDYTSCVAAVTAAWDATQPTLLCVAPDGQWTLVPVTPEEPATCPTDDWTVAARMVSSSPIAP